MKTSKSTPEEDRNKRRGRLWLPESRGSTWTNNSPGRRTMNKPRELPGDDDSTARVRTSDQVRGSQVTHTRTQQWETRETRVRRASGRDSSRISRVSGPGGEVRCVREVTCFSSQGGAEFERHASVRSALTSVEMVAQFSLSALEGKQEPRQGSTRAWCWAPAPLCPVRRSRTFRGAREERGLREPVRSCLNTGASACLGKALRWSVLQPKQVRGRLPASHAL